MKRECPYCEKKILSSEHRPRVISAGRFKRKSDHRLIRRFRCLGCRKYFSHATGRPCFGQNKRQFNERLLRMMCSGMSMRRSAKILRISRTTVARKLEFLGEQALLKLESSNEMFNPSSVIEFDDMETFEHTKCKPLSITLAVEHPTRRILGFKVSKMPAKGHLAKLAVKKYGIRKDERSKGRRELFKDLQKLVSKTALIKSDENPHYPSDVKRYFPLATHQAFKGQRGSIVGQGELKKVRFDPLFRLNHTCAMLRANINRLFRRTWCTTKNPQRLAYHIAIYATYHNFTLLDGS